MKQKVLSILALLLMAVTGAWADTTVTWTESDMSGLQVSLDGYVADNNTIKGITVTASGGGEGEWFENNINNYSESSTTITFTSSVGNIKSIAIKANDIEIFSNPPGGWTLSNDYTKLSWSGDASSTVSLLLSAGEGFCDISEIVFTIEPDPTYIVAGNNAEIFGSTWDGTYEANKMTKGGDGKYTKTYNVEDAIDDIQFKVVKDGEDWIGDETGNNVTFSMKQAGSFTVTLDPNANPVYVTVTGDNVVFADTEYAINYATGMQNGTVTGPDTAKEGDEVTLTITPAAGYVLESISVTGVTTENAVEVTDGKFTMPAEDVNVIATFKLVTYAITLAEGTEDFDKWTISPTEAAEGGETVTVTYSGERKVKSVKAVKKAAGPGVTTFSELQAALSAGKDVKLMNDIVCTAEIEITSDEPLTIDGNGKKLSTTSEIRAFKVGASATVAFKNLTLTGFVNEGGPAINNKGTIVLDGCTISNCHVSNGDGGGAIENKSSGKLYAINTTFSGNYSGEIGGAINNYRGSLYMSDCTFTDNYTTSSDAYYGGAIGINSGDEVRLINCSFSGNKYGTATGLSDIGVFFKPDNYTIAGCTGVTIASGDGNITTIATGTATLDYSDLSNISFTYTPITVTWNNDIPGSDPYTPGGDPFSF